MSIAKRAARKVRQRATRAMNKCRCGNVAKLGKDACTRCNDAAQAFEGSTLTWVVIDEI